jgi:peptidoglycan/xylan/chitin deacetylase (PgdA/CDA1 family)
VRRGFRVLILAALVLLIGAPSVLAVALVTSNSSTKPVPRIRLATSLPAQIPVLLYHGIGTPSPVAGSVGNYNVTMTNFKADMAALAAAGYATVTPQQYVAWLHGINIRLPVKPILITFDDAFWSDTLATPILAQYGFHAVMFVVTGYADGMYGSEYAPWKIVSALPGQGWYLQLHAGKCGHANLPYAPAVCLTGMNKALINSAHYQYYIWNFGQTDAEFEARVEKDIRNGLADFTRHAGFPADWRSLLFAAPFGAWSNGENPWLDRYLDSQFSVIFTQQINASKEAVAKKYHVRYRLELGYGAQSANYVISNLNNLAFTRAGATGTVGSAPTAGSG